MTRAERLKRLRDLIAEIELLPVSPERDRLLSEFRGRTVDVDTGVAPRAMRPMADPTPVPVRASRRPRTAASARDLGVDLPPPVPPGGRAESPGEPFWVAAWMTLD